MLVLKLPVDRFLSSMPWVRPPRRYYFCKSVSQTWKMSSSGVIGYPSVHSSFSGTYRVTRKTQPPITRSAVSSHSNSAAAGAGNQGAGTDAS
jgi:hypothetical protein